MSVRATGALYTGLVRLLTHVQQLRDDARSGIVDLVRNARLDAKIDSRDNHVIMGATRPTVHQQVLDKTKDLATRTYVLARSLRDHVGELEKAKGK